MVQSLRFTVQSLGFMLEGFRFRVLVTFGRS